MTTATKGNSFRRSFLPDVSVPRNGKPCELFRHYRGILREAIKWLDKLAAKDPDRFVWEYQSNTAKRMKRWRKEDAQGKQKLYSPRQLKYAIEFFRQQGVISAETERVRKGLPRKGFIVLRHDDLFSRRGKECHFHDPFLRRGKGWADPDTKFRLIEDLAEDDRIIFYPDLTTEEIEKMRAEFRAKFGAKTARDTALDTARDTALDTARAQNQILPSTLPSESEKNCADYCPTQSAQPTENSMDAESEQKSCTSFAGSYPCEPSSFNRGSQSNRANLNYSTLKNSQSENQVGPSSLRLNEETNPNPARPCGIENPNGQPTIGQHFEAALDENDEGFFEELTAGEYADTKERRLHDHRNLRKCCEAVINEMGDQPYLGRATNAMLMDNAMKSLRKQFGKDAPKPWLPMIRKLRSDSDSAGFNSQRQEQACDPYARATFDQWSDMVLRFAAEGAGVELPQDWQSHLPNLPEKLSGWRGGHEYLGGLDLAKLPDVFTKLHDWMFEHDATVSDAERKIEKIFSDKGR